MSAEHDVSKISQAQLLIVISAVLLSLGLVLPSLQFRASDDLADLIQVFRGLPTHHSYSILGGILELRFSNVLLGLILFAFSVVFPYAKLALLYAWASEVKQAQSNTIARWQPVVEKVGKWSMVDVFVIAILVVTQRTFSGVEIKLGLGFYIFGAAILLSLVVAPMIRRGIQD